MSVQNLVHVNNQFYVRDREKAYDGMAKAHLSLATTNLVLYFFSEDSNFQMFHIGMSLMLCKRIWGLQCEQVANREQNQIDSFREIHYSYGFMEKLSGLMGLRFVHSLIYSQSSTMSVVHLVASGMYFLGAYKHSRNHQEFKNKFDSWFS